MNRNEKFLEAVKFWSLGFLLIYETSKLPDFDIWNIFSFLFCLFVKLRVVFVLLSLFRAQHKNGFLILYLVSELSKWPQDLLQYEACDFRHIHHLALNEKTSKLYIWYELRYDPWYRKNKIFCTWNSVILP